MLVPKLRFKREDGTSYPALVRCSLDKALEEIKNYGTFETGFPLLTSSRTGLMYQNEYRDNVSTSNQSTQFSIVGRGECTYRHMSDDSIFHFNINALCDNGLVSKEYPVFSTQEGYDLNFVVQHLNSSLRFLEFCRQQKKGGTRTRLYFKTLCDYEMYFPCFEEQQKIADFLSTVDEVIAQSEAEVANLEQQKKAAMQKIFSQEERFKREDGTEYPEWKYARTDEIAEINPKTLALPDLFYYMDLGSVSMGAWEEKTITDKDNAPSRANRLASVGDVFFQSVRPYNMGHFILEEEYDFPVVASTGFIQLRAKKGYCNGFIYQLLYEDRFNAEVNIRCTGSNYPAINSENFAEIEMLFPCLEEQQKIADFLSAYDEAISYAKQELEHWKQLKKGLLQQMFV